MNSSIDHSSKKFKRASGCDESKYWWVLQKIQEKLQLGWIQVLMSPPENQENLQQLWLKLFITPQKIKTDSCSNESKYWSTFQILRDPLTVMTHIIDHSKDIHESLQKWSIHILIIPLIISQELLTVMNQLFINPQKNSREPPEEMIQSIDQLSKKFKRVSGCDESKYWSVLFTHNKNYNLALYHCFSYRKFKTF